MEPEFQHILMRVLLVGGFIALISGGGLYFAFRAFGEENTDGRQVIMVVALLVFVLLACLMLLRFSYLR